MMLHNCHSFPFFFNDTATTEIYTLSLHDALPISARTINASPLLAVKVHNSKSPTLTDRKSTRLNSSHQKTSYAVFCLKKKTIVTPVETSAYRSWLAARAFGRASASAPSCYRPVGSPFVPSCHPVLFFFNDTATTEIYTLSLHDALPI